MPRSFPGLRVWPIVALLAWPAALEARQTALRVDLTAAWVGFADDGIVSEALVGGAARWRLTRRISLGPEAVFIQGDNHSHFVLTGNLTFDFTPAGVVQPFVVVGAGLFQTRESFTGENFTSSEGAFTVGGGVRGRITDRVSAGVDARVGWEPHLRIGGTVGIRLGR